VNRKDINDIIKILLPVSSSVVGAPRRVADMNGYLKNNPGAGTIEMYEDSGVSDDHIVLPSFFKSYHAEGKCSKFIARLHTARVWGINGAVIGAGDHFISDVSREFNKGLNIEHSVYYTIKQVTGKLLKGTVAVIGTAGANIYYHWMLDILPRLALVTKNISLNEVDYFITEFAGLSFQKETLHKIGVPENKIVASNDNWNFHIKADTLLVPSLAGPLDQPTSFQVDFLKSMYKDCISTKPAFRKIYISRKKTGRREIVNEEELLSCISKQNFEVIHCEEMKVGEQAQLFSEAAVIICSHGSALTNLAFCKPGTIILDIFNTSHINPCFWFLSRLNKLDYHFLQGTSKSIDGNPKNDNTIINIKDFKMMLHEMGLHE
jgi:capsular polysaccharide biosynthesis protein